MVRVDLAVARLIKALPLRLRIAPTNTLGQSICSMAMAPGMVENDSLTAAARVMAPVIRASRPRIAAGFMASRTLYFAIGEDLIAADAFLTPATWQIISVAKPINRKFMMNSATRFAVTPT